MKGQTDPRSTQTRRVLVYYDQLDTQVGHNKLIVIMTHGSEYLKITESMLILKVYFFHFRRKT